MLVHSDFTLNHRTHSKKDLLDLANTYLNSPEATTRELGSFLTALLNDKKDIPFYTSGTTQTPKKILFSKESLIQSALLTKEFFNLPNKSKVLHCLPISFIAGKMMWVRALVLGWNMEVVPPSSKPLKNNTTQYDFAAMVPLQVQNSLSSIKNIKQLIIGGGTINNELREKILTIPTKCYETFGMTETLTHIAVRKIQREKTPFTTLKSITVGISAKGCLEIFAPHIQKEKIRTHDVVSLLSDNEFYWLGRSDNIINSGGVKLHPELIEQKLSPIIPCPFFVMGIDEPSLGKKVAIVLESETDPSLMEKIKKANRLTKYEMPKECIFISTFKRTESGKIKRQETLKTYFP